MEESVNVETNEKPKRQKRSDQNQHPDRIRIDPLTLARLNQLNEQVSERLRGVKLTRSDLVNFLILSHPEFLSAVEMKDLETKYFDEVKFAQWALEELKVARIRGQTMSLQEIIANNGLQREAKKPRKARKTIKDSEPTSGVSSAST